MRDAEAARAYLREAGFAAEQIVYVGESLGTGVAVQLAARVPPALIEQLRPGGRLVIPIGPMFGPQELLLIDKDRAGVCASRSVLGVAFVPLTGASSLPAAAGA